MPTRKLLRATKQDSGSYLNGEPVAPFYKAMSALTEHKALEIFQVVAK